MDLVCSDTKVGGQEIPLKSFSGATRCSVGREFTGSDCLSLLSLFIPPILPSRPSWLSSPCRLFIHPCAAHSYRHFCWVRPPTSDPLPTLQFPGVGASPTAGVCSGILRCRQGGISGLAFQPQGGLESLRSSVNENFLRVGKQGSPRTVTTFRGEHCGL